MPQLLSAVSNTGAANFFLISFIFRRYHMTAFSSHAIPVTLLSSLLIFGLYFRNGSWSMTWLVTVGTCNCKTLTVPIVKGAPLPHIFRRVFLGAWATRHVTCLDGRPKITGGKAHRLIVLSRTRSSSHRTSSQQLSSALRTPAGQHRISSFLLLLIPLPFPLSFSIWHSHCELRNNRYFASPIAQHVDC